MSHFAKKRLKLGLLSNEVFDTTVGRMGGFGWAVQQVSRCFADDKDLGVDVVVIMGEKQKSHIELPKQLHGSSTIWRAQSRINLAKRLWTEKIDLMLCIDYRANYRTIFNCLPRTPIIIWVRDPWDDDDRTDVATLTIPGNETERPSGSVGPDARSLAGVFRMSRIMRRPLHFATTTSFLAPKVTQAYDCTPSAVHELPNIVNIIGSFEKSKCPKVAYLARLDPTKRPWLLFALAERFPNVQFSVMGQAHFTGKGAWQACSIPNNVQMLGHVGEARKAEELSSSWLLINTAIHEGLSVSFLEALACETPIVACVDPEGIVSKFGCFVGKFLGSGTDALQKLESAVHVLLNNSELRLQLGTEGRRWVNSTHNKRKFIESFSKLCALSNLELPPGLNSKP